jgi:hypothetical protein
VNAKKRKQLRKQFEELTFAQLVALTVQKADVTLSTAKASTREALIDTLITVDGALKPEETK